MSPDLTSGFWNFSCVNRVGSQRWSGVRSGGALVSGGAGRCPESRRSVEPKRWWSLAWWWPWALQGIRVSRPDIESDTNEKSPTDQGRA